MSPARDIAKSEAGSTNPELNDIGKEMGDRKL
jgi:hypothetical protein